jgi:peptidoglycan/xylan/chitin deacetylase (PgdA/CDA1 family)
MASKCVVGFALVVLAVSGLSSALAKTPSSPADPGLLARCWTPEALAGTDKELKPVRPGQRLDLAGLKQEPLPDAAPVGEGMRGSIRSVELPPGEKLIALTFDLCETKSDRAGYDGRIVDLLRAQGAKATFFAGGKWLETHPERAQQLMADPNFEIGGHSLLHRDLSRATGQTLAEEINLTEAAFARARKALEARECVASEAQAADAVQERITVMRFPYGRCNAKSLAAVAKAGELAIQWDVVTGDPDPHISAKTIANTILTHAHGRGRNTAAALAIALPKLKEEGYRFVTVSELIAAGKPVIADTCYLNRPGEVQQVAHAKRRVISDDIWSILRR